MLGIAQAGGIAGSARRCVFCGRPDELTREHLLPDWLQDVLPVGELVTHFRAIGRAAARTEWEAQPFRATARVVCRPCNNGWMSRLESKAKPILVPLLNHQRSRIGASPQQTLAAWALKTSLVFQASQTDVPIAPSEHFAALARSGPPPPQVSVWLTSHYRARFDRLSSIYLQRPLGLTSADPRLHGDHGAGYLVFLAISCVGFVIVGHTYASETSVAYDGALRDALLQIWPLRDAHVAWPPHHMMDQDLVEVLALPEEGLTLMVRPSEQRRQR